MTTLTFRQLLRLELGDARAKNKQPLNSWHEAYAVILEELDEAWLEIMKRREDRSPERIISELLQVAAMCQRACEDVGRLPQDQEDVRAREAATETSRQGKAADGKDVPG